MPHRKRRLLSLMDVAMGRVWVRLPRCSSKPLQAALRAGNPIDRTRTFIGTLLDPGYRDESAAIFKKEELARFMDGNLGVAYIMSGTQAGKTAGEDVARAFSLKHLQPRTLAPGEMLQEGQCVGCHVPPEKHEPGCSLDCLGPETYGPRIETMAAPPPDTPYPGPSAPTGEQINTCSAAPAPDKAKEQTIEEMCMTWKNAMPMHNASDAVNDHIRNLMTKVYDHSVAPRVKLITFLKQESATRLDDITKVALNQMQERKDATEQIKGLQEHFANLQAEYRELFGKLNQACKRLDIAPPNNLQDATASIKAITDHAIRLREEVRIGNDSLSRLGGLPAGTPYLTTLFEKPLDYWQELEDLFKVAAAERDLLRTQMEAMVSSPPQSADARLLIHVGELRVAAEKVTAKLKLKPGTPTEVILDTIQSIQQHAEIYRMSSHIVPGDRIISGKEHDKLLAIERGHQLDKDAARCAQAENYSLREQLKLIGAALNRAGFRDAAPEHAMVSELASRYLKMEGEYHKAWGKFVNEQREHHATAMDYAKKLEKLGNELAEARRPIYGVSPMVLAIPVAQKAMALQQKVAALRNIVQRKAPHTSDCFLKGESASTHFVGTIGGGEPTKCGCWKAEFMAEADKA